jgi:signal transduction histidine kinase
MIFRPVDADSVTGSAAAIRIGNGAVEEDVLRALIGETGAGGGTLACAAGCLATVSLDAPGDERTFPIAGGYRLVLTGAKVAPTPGSLRLASLALQAAAERMTQRMKTSRLEAQAGAMLEITRAICNVPVIDELLTLVAERCRQLLRCEVAGFALLEDDAKTIVWRAMSGCRTETYRRVTYEIRAGVAGRAMTTGQPVIIRDFLTDGGIDPSEFPISFAEGLRSALGVPLEIGKRARGCLMVGYRTVHDFAADEIDTLTSFSMHAAIAIENAQLYERLWREQAHLESVVQSINEGLVLVDLPGRITYANRQARNFLRITPPAALDESREAFLENLARQTADPAGSIRELTQLHESLAEFPSCDLVLRGVEAVNLRLTHFNVYDSKGERLGCGYLCRDVTFEKQVDAMKTEVISLVSHEIKTPLASIRGYASALLDDSRKRGRSLERDYVKMIDSESARLGDLVCNLTDVSKLDAGVLVLEKHVMSPAYLLRSVITRWQKANPERRFALACDDRSTPLELDRRRIAQVLDNLLSNAVKYSPADSEISIELSEDDNSVAFSVKDRGIGVPRTLRKRVFERFYRATTQRREGDGSGLGLYISRGIVLAHQGEIRLASGVDAGTTVTFTLPKEGPHAVRSELRVG